MAGLLCGALLAAPMAVHSATVTVTPQDGATGVSTTADVVFAFSEAMDTDEFATTISILSINPFGMPDYTVTWSTDGKTATARPTTSWPPNATLMWSIDGTTADGEYVDDILPGSFRTGSGSSGGGGAGTNAVTSFSVMVFHFYEQTNATAPVLDADEPYGFMAVTSLASNHTANSISVTPPGSQAMPLTRNMLYAENFFFMDYTNNLALFNQRYPAGGYNFVMNGNPSLNATATLQATSQQPPAPHIANYAAAQSVVATQAFTLTWDAWADGTAQDYIQVSVGTNWHSPYMHEAGALRGNATSVTIPANRLQPNTTYTASIEFTRMAFITNTAPVYVTSATRSTTTEFTLATTSGLTPTAPLLTHTTQVAGGKFGFSVVAPAGQSLTLLGSETLLSNSWTTVYTTNAASGTTLIVLPQDPSGKRFYRLRSP